HSAPREPDGHRHRCQRQSEVAEIPNALQWRVLAQRMTSLLEEVIEWDHHRLRRREDVAAVARVDVHLPSEKGDGGNDDRRPGSAQTLPDASGPVAAMPIPDHAVERDGHDR